MVIYKTTNTVNGKIYVGQDSNNDPNYLGSGVLLSKAVEKYGKQNFIKEVLEQCSTKEELNEREKYWIKELNTQNSKIGYNLSEGGRGGNTYTEEIKERVSKQLKNRYVSAETREKMSKSRTGKKYQTEESKKIISETHKEKKLSEEHIKRITEFGKTSKKSEAFTKNIGNIQQYWGKGSKHTEETKKRMSDSHKANPVKHWKGKKRTQEAIEKAKKSNEGFKHSEEHKKKISGEGNPFYGKTHTDDVKKKISEALKGLTPEQKLDRYAKFYFSRTGKEPTIEQLSNKLKEYKNV